MTEGFGNATADPTRLPPTGRQQLQDAGDPAFLSELEQHQQQIDQMLGANPYQR